MPVSQDDKSKFPVSMALRQGNECQDHPGRRRMEKPVLPAVAQGPTLVVLESGFRSRIGGWGQRRGGA